MKALLHFFKAWLLLCFALTFFVLPIYLVAIYPDIPEPYYRLSRTFGHGLVRGPASELAFWYRLLSCGAIVAVGLLIGWHWLSPPNRGKR